MSDAGLTGMHERPADRSLWGPSLLLLAVNVQPALNVWTQNVARAPYIVSLVVLCLIGTALSFAIVFLLSHGFRRNPRPAFRLVSVGAFMFLAWGPLRLDRSGLEQFAFDLHDLLPALIGVLLFMANRALAHSKTFVTFFGAFIASLVLVSSVSIVWESARLRPARLSAAAPVPFAPGRRPDIYYIVLDGYGRADVLRSLYGFDNAAFLRALEARGFTIPAEAVANYTMTYASVASALAMNHVLANGTPVGPSQRVALYRAIGGDNPVVASLRAAGWEYVHLESGWGGSRCGPAVDTCMRAPLLNETAWAYLKRTPLAVPAARLMGHAFTYDGLDRLGRLRDLVPSEPPGRRKPRFAFAHILLPHPPLFSDSGCRIQPDGDLAGMNITAHLAPELTRRRQDAYVEQIVCVNTRILELIDSIDRVDRGSIVVLSADHGPDSLYQLLTPVEEWTPDAIRERTSIFSALRLPGGCGRSLPPDLTLVNSLRHVFSCALGADLPPLQDRFFLVPTEEVFPGARVRQIDVP